MKKIVMILIALLVISVGILSGCNEQETKKDERSQGTKIFSESLSDIDNNLGISLGNINTHLYNYDFDYKWIVLMNYLTFTVSMINDMSEFEDNIAEEVSYIEDVTDEYQQLKLEANLDQLKTDEKDIMNSIDKAIVDYQTSELSISLVLDAIKTYRQFINLTRIKIILLEDYDSTLTLMNSKVENEQYSQALVNAREMKNLSQDLKVNAYDRSNLSIINFSELDLSVWDLYIDSWELYIDYLNLLIQNRFSQADTKYTEYSNKYNEALEIVADESITEINNEIDQWYQDNIAISLNLFEEYS